MLHVADKSIVPVDNIERTVWCKLQVDRAEVAILGFEQIVTVLGGVSRAFLNHLVLFGSEVADGIV